VSNLDDGFELTELVSKLRDDLEYAMVEGAGQSVRFKLEAIELELKVVAKHSGEGKTGIKFWVLNAEAGGKLENERSQTIKLKMVPQLATESARGNRDVEIAAGIDEVPR
jgi:hypothetical protein